MGILAENLDWLMTLAAGRRSMLELGNQTLFIATRPWSDYPAHLLNPNMENNLVAAKRFFSEAGWKHTSIDLNGLDGSLSRDLSDQYWNLGLPTFDVITDFGTSEHVADLYNCLNGVHDCAGFGTLIFHINPAPGSWPGHGQHYRGEQFYREYAALAQYEIVNIKTAAACGNTTDGWNTWCCLRKLNAMSFPSRDEFNLLPIAQK